MVDVARKLLVGRRFIHLTGPLGMGVQTVSVPTVSGGEACLHDDEGCACAAGGCEVIQVTGRRFLSLPFIHQDFCLSWRDIEASRRMRHCCATGGGRWSWVQPQQPAPPVPAPRTS